MTLQNLDVVSKKIAKNGVSVSKFFRGEAPNQIQRKGYVFYCRQTYVLWRSFETKIGTETAEKECLEKTRHKV